MADELIMDEDQKPKRRWPWILAALLIGATVTGATWWWMNEKVKTERDQKDQLQSQVQTLRDQVNDLEKEHEEGQKMTGYYEFEELGLRIKVGDDLKDLVYHITGSGDERTIYASSRSLMSLDYPGGSGAMERHCGPYVGPLGAISKSLKSSQGAKKVGSFYVTFASSQATCSNDKKVQDLQTQQKQSLQKAFETIEPISS